jgi:hypothetical protein
MQDALWNTAEHTGLQIVHAHADANGSLRKYSKPHKSGASEQEPKFDVSFRDVSVQDTDIETDYESLKI